VGVARHSGPEDLMNATTLCKATTIWQQLPLGVKLRLGARRPMGDEVTGRLQFTVGPCRGWVVLQVVVTLDPSDTYAVRLVRIDLRGLGTETLEEADGVYCDQLGDLLVRWEGRHLVS
jgi:hypothetical protein